jgi:hypothetical protein
MPQYVLCFDSRGVVRSSSELVGQHGLESYSAKGLYWGPPFAPSDKIQLVLEPTPNLGFMTGWAWPWEYVELTCSLAKTQSTLTFSACEGTRETQRIDGSVPPPPVDMVFDWQ